jgi:hypothetical protein
MRVPFFLLGFTAVFSTVALGEDDCRCWTPDAADIAALEAKIESHPKPRGLDQYARYYAGMVGRSGVRFIRIHLVPSGRGHPAGSHVVAPAPQPSYSECSGWEAGGELSLRCMRASLESWTPGADEIAAMEAKIAEQPMPLGSLDRYARYYAGVAGKMRGGLDRYVQYNAGVATGKRNRVAGDGGRSETGVPPFLKFPEVRNEAVRGILGALIPAGGDDLSRAHIEQTPLGLMEEGCVAAFDADRAQLTSFKCTGPGAWTLTIAEVAELEDLLSHHGGPKLEDYGRYYSPGVMYDDRKVIFGRILPAPDFEAGIYIGRGGLFVSDGGCRAFVTVWYDLSSKAAAWQCNGPHDPTSGDDWGVRAYDPASGKTMQGREAARGLQVIWKLIR